MAKTITNILKQTVNNRRNWCTKVTKEELNNLDAPELLARMIYGECTPEKKDNMEKGYRKETIAFWKIV